MSHRFPLGPFTRSRSLSRHGDLRMSLDSHRLNSRRERLPRLHQNNPTSAVNPRKRVLIRPKVVIYDQLRARIRNGNDVIA